MKPPFDRTAEYKFKSNLKFQRSMKGYSQTDLSLLSGVNQKSIALYEQKPDKLNAASVETVYKLSEALGCDISDIVQKDIIRAV